MICSIGYSGDMNMLSSYKSKSVNRVNMYLIDNI